MRAVDFRESVTAQLASIIKARGFEVRVLSGLDPGTGQVGRDLDVLVPSARERDLLEGECATLLKKSGARWVSRMHPIWGPRCIGVWQQEFIYYELHMLPKLSFGPVDAVSVFGLEPAIECRGMSFSPGLYFFKRIISRHGRKILRGEKLWEHEAPSPWLRSFSSTIGGALRTFLPGSDELVSSLLGPDTTENRSLRQAGLRRLIVSFSANHPIRAMALLGRSPAREVAALGSPCAPSVALVTRTDRDLLQAGLDHRISTVFPGIFVSETVPGWLERRRLQASQRLVVLKVMPGQQIPSGFDLTIHMRDDPDREVALDHVCCEVLDAVERLNARWNRT